MNAPELDTLKSELTRLSFLSKSLIRFFDIGDTPNEAKALLAIEQKASALKDIAMMLTRKFKNKKYLSRTIETDAWQYLNNVAKSLHYISGGQIQNPRGIDEAITASLKHLDNAKQIINAF